jgi:hypothetical protein
VELTEAGDAAHGRMLGAVIAFTTRLQAGMSSDDLRFLDHQLARLDENVRTSPLPRTE